MTAMGRGRERTQHRGESAGVSEGRQKKGSDSQPSTMRPRGEDRGRKWRLGCYGRKEGVSRRTRWSTVSAAVDASNSPLDLGTRMSGDLRRVGMGKLRSQ